MTGIEFVIFAVVPTLSFAIGIVGAFTEGYPRNDFSDRLGKYF